MGRCWGIQRQSNLKDLVAKLETTQALDYSLLLCQPYEYSSNPGCLEYQTAWNKIAN